MERARREHQTGPAILLAFSPWDDPVIIWLGQIKNLAIFGEDKARNLCASDPLLSPSDEGGFAFAGCI